MLEDEDGWEVPWSGYRYYDFDELFELYVHREGKPLTPPAKLVLVEGPSGEQVPVLVPNDEEPELEAEAQAQESEALRPVALGRASSSEEEAQPEEAAAAPVSICPLLITDPRYQVLIPRLPRWRIPAPKGPGNSEPRTGKPWSRA